MSASSAVGSGCSGSRSWTTRARRTASPATSARRRSRPEPGAYPVVKARYATWPTTASRSGRSAGDGIPKSAPANRFRARVSRAAIVASGTRKSRATSRVGTPTTSRRLSALADFGASDGWAQRSTSRSTSSSTTSPTSAMTRAAAASCSASTTSSGSLRTATASARSRSTARRRAAVSSQAGGLVGTPSTGQCRAAASNPSDRASSARSRRRYWPTSSASSRPQCCRYAASSAASASTRRG